MVRHPLFVVKEKCLRGGGGGHAPSLIQFSLFPQEGAGAEEDRTPSQVPM